MVEHRENGQLPVIDGYHEWVPVGRGGFGRVFSGRDAQQRPVAVKLLDATVTTEQRARLLAVNSALRSQPIQGFATVLAVAGTVDFVVTELLPGGSATDRIQRTGPLSSDEVRLHGHRLAIALHTLHGRGHLHGNLKPANVLYDANQLPTLTDAGFDYTLGGAQHPDAVRSTLRHTAPEVLEDEPLTAASDQYSLASTLWELTTGRPPFAVDDDLTRTIELITGPDSYLAPTTLPDNLESVLRRAMDRVPSRRFGSLSEFATALLPAPLSANLVPRIGSGSPAPVPSWPPVAEKAMAAADKPGRNRSLIVLGIIAVLALGAVSRLYAWRGTGGRQTTVNTRSADAGTASSTGSSAPVTSTVTSVPATTTATTVPLPLEASTAPVTTHRPVTVRVSRTRGADGRGDGFLTERSAPTGNSAGLHRWTEGSTLTIVCQINGSEAKSSVWQRSSPIWSRTSTGGYVANIFLDGIDQFSVTTPCT